MTSKLVTIGTDVAALFLFHPDDLVHRRDHPIAWYTYDFIYGADAADGRLIAFYTGSDGGYALRLTTEGPTPREMQWAVGSWTFRYRVRHGRVFVDNSDALPGQEQMSDAAALPDNWFDLGDGAYAVTVHAIAWHEEPGAKDERGRPRADALPDYVVAFDPVDDLQAIASAPTPPDLRGVRGWAPEPSAPTWSEQVYLQPDGEPLAAQYPVLVAPQARLSTGFPASIPAPEHVREVSPAEDDGWLPGLARNARVLAVAPDATAGAPAVLARLSGSSRRGDELPQLSVLGGRLVRLGDIAEERGWLWSAVSLVQRPASTVAPTELDALKAQIAALAVSSPAFRARLESPRFELARMRTIASAEALTGWLVHFLDLPQAQALELLSQSDADRVAALRVLLPAR